MLTKKVNWSVIQMNLQAESAKKHMSPTVWYLLIALATGAIAWCAMFIIVPLLEKGVFWSNEIFAWIHLAILGSLLTGAFGVMFQLIPIAFQAPPLPKKVAIWHLPLHLIAISIMIYGFLRMQFNLVGVGGSLLFVTTFSYLLQVYRSYKNANNKTIVHRRLWLPILGLALVMGIGIWQAFTLPGTGLPLLFSHIMIGVLWFWGGLVLVISYKFIPMFVLSHGYYANLNLTSVLYFSGIFLIAISSYWPFPGAPLPSLFGTVFALGGVILFLQDVRRIIIARKRKRIVFPLKISITSTMILAVSIALLLLSTLVHSLHLGMIAGYLFYFAGMVPLLMGYSQKIVPFLYYEYRFSHAPDRKNAPLIDEMVPHLPARLAMILYAISVALGFLLFILYQFIPSVLLPSIFILLSILGTVAFTILLISLITVLLIGGKRPLEE